MTVIVNMSDWAAIRITGGDRVRFLNGLTTINVPALAVGSAAWGAMLNPKGRVMSMVELTAADDHFTLRCEPVLADKTVALLARYAVMDDVEFLQQQQIGYRIWDHDAAPWTARFMADAVPNDAVAIDHATAQAARIIAGMPSYGVDVDERCFPFETALVTFIDYEKGCYVGQEPVFRVHAQGNAARAMRVLAIDGSDDIVNDASVAHTSRSNAGEVTSSVRYGDGVIALAYLHRTVLDHHEGFTVAGRTATPRVPVTTKS
jgi:tRNA-modifying protein YgfZ